MTVTFPTREGQPELPDEWDEPRVEELIAGAIDTHTHPFPSPFPRRMGIMELARDAAAARYRALVIKSHHHSMVPEILALQAEAGLGDIPVKVFGGTPTNSSVGGLNPHAVHLCLSLGGRWVWLPTLSSAAHLSHVAHERAQGRRGFQVATTKQRSDDLVSVLDDDGHVRPELTEICELIAEHDAVLCGGHLSADEFDKVIDEAVRVGVQRIVCSHPQFIVGASPERTAEWARKGVYMEHVVGAFGQLFEGRDTGRMGTEDLRAYIDAVGPSRVILVSDRGQHGKERPVNAMRGGIRQLIRMGYSDDAIRTMTGGSAANVLLRASDDV